MNLNDHREAIIESALKTLGRAKLFLSADARVITDPETGEQWRVRVGGDWRREDDRDLKALFTQPSDFVKFRGGSRAPRLNVVAVGGGPMSAVGEAARDWLVDHDAGKHEQTIEEWIEEQSRFARRRTR